MSIKRVVDTKFWEDEKVLNEFTPEDKYFFLYLLTNPRTTLLGVYRFVPKQAAFDMGYSVEAVVTLLERFENKYQTIRYNRATCEIAIKNYLRYGIVSGGKPVLDMLTRTAREVVDKSLIDFVREGATGREKNDTVRRFLEEYESPSPIPPTPNGNGNGNGNGDGESYPDSYHDSYPESLTPRFSVNLGMLGTFKNIQLSQTEIDKLKAAYPDYMAKIDRLSEYVESKGVKYKSHYATILSWAKQDEKEGKVKVVAESPQNWVRLNGQ